MAQRVVPVNPEWLAERLSREYPFPLIVRLDYIIGPTIMISIPGPLTWGIGFAAPFGNAYLYVHELPRPGGFGRYPLP